MLKKLLFAEPFPAILFSGRKTKTFRVTGGDNYDLGEEIALCTVEGEEFAQAIVFSKTRKKFKDLKYSDWIGHERFTSDEEMYKTYSKWEGFQVGPDTALDIIEYRGFRITNQNLVQKIFPGELNSFTKRGGPDQEEFDEKYKRY